MKSLQFGLYLPHDYSDPNISESISIDQINLPLEGTEEFKKLQDELRF